MKTTKYALLLLCLSLSALSGHAGVSKNQRRLLIVSELTKYGVGKYKWLYQFLDANTVSMAQAMVGNKYRSVSVLSGSQASADNFVHRLKTLTHSSQVKALDVIVSLHGMSNKLYFRDGEVTTQALRDEIKSRIPLSKRRKFRLMYNLACYGSTHNNEFRSAGFRGSLGSKLVNTASGSEYPVFLSRWGMGHRVKSILMQTNNDPAMFVSDNAAKLMGFSNPNSKKVFSGFNLNINNNAY